MITGKSILRSALIPAYSSSRAARFTTSRLRTLWRAMKMALAAAGMVLALMALVLMALLVRAFTTRSRGRWTIEKVG